MRIACVIFLGMLGALFAGCSRANEPPPVKFLDTPEGRWYAANNQRVSQTAIRFRDGSCFDAARLAPAWMPIDQHQFHFQTIAADPNLVRIRPALREAKPADKRFAVSVSGWSFPPPPEVGWPVAAPERVDEDIRIGIIHPITIWRDAKGLEAFAGPGDEREYADKLRYTQCRDYAHNPIIACRVVSRDGQYAISFSVHPLERGRLPEIIATLSRTIQSARGPCPVAGKAVHP